MYKYMYLLSELCEVYYFSAENPSLSATCGSYKYKKQLKGTLLAAILNLLSLSQFILQVLIYRMRKYPNFLIRLLLTICINKF